jgi:2-C-methyl-D-erythritol 4-phosphate cytidylyltransferase
LLNYKFFSKKNKGWMKKFVLIVAGGTGSRMEAGSPKQFLLVAQKPILIHTIEIFIKYDPAIEIVVILPEHQMEAWEKLCRDYSFTAPHKICFGGEKRYHSVKNGLSEIEGGGIVFIHDGVRPLVSIDTLDRCFTTAAQKGNAIPVAPVTESLRKVELGKNSAVDRSKYFLIQTPQTFKVKDIKKAYEQDYSPFFTDDASVLEATGKTINLVDGNRENIKITYPEDLENAEILFALVKSKS